MHLQYSTSELSRQRQLPHRLAADHWGWSFRVLPNQPPKATLTPYWNAPVLGRKSFSPERF